MWLTFKISRLYEELNELDKKSLKFRESRTSNVPFLFSFQRRAFCWRVNPYHQSRETLLITTLLVQVGKIL